MNAYINRGKILAVIIELRGRGGEKKNLARYRIRPIC